MACHLPLDADGDGDALTSGANGVVLFRNDGTGLMLPVPGAFGTTSPLADSGIPAAGDLDGDGDVDLAMATGSGTADVWFNDGFGAFSPEQALEVDSTQSVTLAVGANFEENNAKGIQDDQDDDSASSAGAVYLY